MTFAVCISCAGSGVHAHATRGGCFACAAAGTGLEIQGRGSIARPDALIGYCPGSRNPMRVTGFAEASAITRRAHLIGSFGAALDVRVTLDAKMNFTAFRTRYRPVDREKKIIALPAYRRRRSP